MLNLINFEIKKIFKHRSIYIVLVIIFIFCLLNNYLYKNDYDADGLYKYNNSKDLIKYINNLEKENKKYDVKKNSDKSIYISNKTKIQIAKLKTNYSKNDWRYIKANDYLYTAIYDYYYQKYISNDKEKIENSKKLYYDLLKKYKENNWLYFLKIEKTNLKSEYLELNNKIKSINDISELNILKEKKEKLKFQLNIINYRIKNSINYNNKYLSVTLDNYQKNYLLRKRYNTISDLSYNQKLEYQKIIADYNIDKYILENKVNVNKVNTLNYQLRTIIDDFELFIVLIIIIVSSILISEEFTNGTIKMLLIKPYKRKKVLLSKYLSCLLICLFTITFIIISYLLVGGILFGFKSLLNPVIVYSHNTNKILKINIFLYMLLRIIAKFPMLIIIQTICFVLGIILNSTIGSFSITMLLYTFSEVINRLAINYNIKVMRFFITLNWDYKNYLFGGFSEFKFLDLKKSILIFIIYDIILYGIMFCSFERKNIKNI